MNAESSIKKTFKKNGLSLSIASSVAIHLMLVGGLVYAAMHTEPPKRIDDGDEGMSVMMLDLSAPGAADMTAEAVAPVIEEQPDVKPEEPEPEIEPEIKPEEIQSEPLPEVAQEAKIIIEEPKKTPPPKPKPKPKTPPQPVKKEPAKPATKPASTNNQTVGSTAASSASPKVGSGGSSGKPVNRARPSYPNQARMMGIEGKVVVQFDVDAAGKVVNIRIVSETPKNMFAREVRRAMARWRYEANKPSKNLSTTFIFNLTGNVEMK